MNIVRREGQISKILAWSVILDECLQAPKLYHDFVRFNDRNGHMAANSSWNDRRINQVNPDFLLRRITNDQTLPIWKRLTDWHKLSGLVVVLLVHRFEDADGTRLILHEIGTTIKVSWVDLFENYVIKRVIAGDIDVGCVFLISLDAFWF